MMNDRMIHPVLCLPSRSESETKLVSTCLSPKTPPAACSLLDDPEKTSGAACSHCGTQVGCGREICPVRGGKACLLLNQIGTGMTTPTEFELIGSQRGD